MQEYFQLHRAACNAVLQHHAIQELHGDESLATLLADVVNRTDVGVIQRRSGLRLPLEPGKHLRVAGYFWREELQGDEPMQAGVLGFIDHTHAASAELLQDAVMRDGLADHGATPCYAGD